MVVVSSALGAVPADPCGAFSSAHLPSPLPPPQSPCLYSPTRDAAYWHDGAVGLPAAAAAAPPRTPGALAQCPVSVSISHPRGRVPPVEPRPLLYSPPPATEAPVVLIDVGDAGVPRVLDLTVADADAAAAADAHAVAHPTRVRIFRGPAEPPPLTAAAAAAAAAVLAPSEVRTCRPHVSQGFTVVPPPFHASLADGLSSVQRAAHLRALDEQAMLERRRWQEGGVGVGYRGVGRVDGGGRARSPVRLDVEGPGKANPDPASVWQPRCSSSFRGDGGGGGGDDDATAEHLRALESEMVKMKRLNAALETRVELLGDEVVASALRFHELDGARAGFVSAGSQPSRTFHRASTSASTPASTTAAASSVPAVVPPLGDCCSAQQQQQEQKGHPAPSCAEANSGDLGTTIDRCSVVQDQISTSLKLSEAKAKQLADEVASLLARDKTRTRYAAAAADTSSPSFTPSPSPSSSLPQPPPPSQPPQQTSAAAAAAAAPPPPPPPSAPPSPLRFASVSSAASTAGRRRSLPPTQHADPAREAATGVGGGGGGGGGVSVAQTTAPAPTVGLGHGPGGGVSATNSNSSNASIGGPRFPVRTSSPPAAPSPPPPPPQPQPAAAVASVKEEVLEEEPGCFGHPGVRRSCTASSAPVSEACSSAAGGSSVQSLAADRLATYASAQDALRSGDSEAARRLLLRCAAEGQEIHAQLRDGLQHRPARRVSGSGGSASGRSGSGSGGGGSCSGMVARRGSGSSGGGGSGGGGGGGRSFRSESGRTASSYFGPSSHTYY